MWLLQSGFINKYNVSIRAACTLSILLACGISFNSLIFVMVGSRCYFLLIYLLYLLLDDENTIKIRNKCRECHQIKRRQRNAHMFITLEKDNVAVITAAFDCSVWLSADTLFFGLLVRHLLAYVPVDCVYSAHIAYQ